MILFFVENYGQNPAMMEEDSDSEYDLSNFPRIWNMITYYDNERVIFHPCDGKGIRFIFARRNKRHFIIEMNRQGSNEYGIIQAVKKKDDLHLTTLNDHTGDTVMFYVREVFPYMETGKWSWTNGWINESGIEFVSEKGIWNYREVTPSCEECGGCR